MKLILIQNEKIFSILVLIIVVSIYSFSQEIDNENLVVTHGPYPQNLGSSYVTIIWTTNKHAVPGVNLTGPNGEVRFVRNSNDGIIDGGGMLHKVRISGLNTNPKFEPKPKGTLREPCAKP